VFSFHPVKIITTAEGGMALTNDDEMAWRMSILRSHGITRDAKRMLQEPAGPWYYEQIDLGYNYRMTDLLAALGLSQLERLSEYVERRNLLAHRYDELLNKLPLRLPRVQPGNRSAFHLYVVRLRAKETRQPHRKVFEALRDQGIGVGLHFMPVHLQPYYRSLGFAPGSCPEAEAYGSDAITLPLFPAMTESKQGEVVKALEKSV
jgi:dTDP-4-amino-4,6-dideoxygalactose transaminase